MSKAPPYAAVASAETAPGGTRKHPPWSLRGARRVRKGGPAEIARRRRVHLAEEPPEQSRGGKYRAVVPRGSGEP